jgi:hypothetical protein
MPKPTDPAALQLKCDQPALLIRRHLSGADPTSAQEPTLHMEPLDALRPGNDLSEIASIRLLVLTAPDDLVVEPIRLVRYWKMVNSSSDLYATVLLSGSGRLYVVINGDTYIIDETTQRWISYGQGI